MSTAFSGESVIGREVAGVAVVFVARVAGYSSLFETNYDTTFP